MTTSWIAPLVLFVTFGVAAVAKGRRVNHLARYLQPRLDSRLDARAVARSAIAVEACIALAMAFPARVYAAALVVVMLPSLTAWVLVGDGVRRHVSLRSCECFGGFTAEWFRRQEWVPVLRPAWWALRNGLLCGVALSIVGSNISISQAAPMGVMVVSATAGAALVVTILRIRRTVAIGELT